MIATPLVSSVAVAPPEIWIVRSAFTVIGLVNWMALLPVKVMLLAAAASNITFTGNSAIQFTSPITVNALRTIQISGGATATLDTNGVAIIYAGIIGGGGGLAKTGNSTL